MKLRIMTFLLTWVCNLLDTVCGLIGFITLTVYRPWWDFSFRVYTAKYMLRLREEDLVKRGFITHKK